MGLVLRIYLLVTLLLCLMLGAALLQTVSRVKTVVLNEVREDTDIGLALISAVVTDTSISNQTKRELIVRLSSLVGSEYIAVQLRSLDNQFMFRGTTGAQPNSYSAPGWFVNLLSPRELPEYMHVIPGTREGRVMLQINPARKIEEVWHQISPILYVLAGFILLSYVVVYSIVRHSLNPVEGMLKGLDKISAGNFQTRLKAHGLPELRSVSNRINALADTLGQSQSLEKRLRLEATEAQEQERRHLARELHDEFGQSITAIKALAASDTKKGISSRVGADIIRLCDRLLGVLRGVMRQLHPVILDQLGLTAALQLMVDEWNEVDDEVFCNLSIKGEFSQLDDARKIALYRLVQECLTNTRKHANASLVTVTLRVDHRAGEIYLDYCDNGAGFDHRHTPFGYGMRGLRERVELLHGRLVFDSSPGDGFELECWLPLSPVMEG